MRRTLTALLVALTAGCAADRPAPATPGEPEAEPPAGGSNPAPVLIGVAIGAVLIVALIANSGLSPSPDPPG